MRCNIPVFGTNLVLVADSPGRSKGTVVISVTNSANGPVRIPRFCEHVHGPSSPAVCFCTRLQYILPQPCSQNRVHNCRGHVGRRHLPSLLPHATRMPLSAQESTNVAPQSASLRRPSEAERRRARRMLLGSCDTASQRARGALDTHEAYDLSGARNRSRCGCTTQGQRAPHRASRGERHRGLAIGGATLTVGGSSLHVDRRRA